MPTDGHRDSRIEPTRRLSELAGRTAGLRAFVSASAIGYYGFDRGDVLLSEESMRGDGFLADVVADWEAATAPAADAGLRVCVGAHRDRAGRHGGTFATGCARCSWLAWAAVSAAAGSGCPWIGLDDLIDVYYRAIYDERLTGPVNAVAPMPCATSTTRRRSPTCCTAPRCYRSVAGTANSVGGAGCPRAGGGRSASDAGQAAGPRPSFPAAAPRGCIEASARARLTDHPVGEAAHQGAESTSGVVVQLDCRGTQFVGLDAQADRLAPSLASHASSSGPSSSGWN